MKSTFLFFFLFFLVFKGFSQISHSDKRKLHQIVGKDFIELTPQKSYPYTYLEKDFKVDLSTCTLGDTAGVSFHNEHLLWHDLISFYGKEEIFKLAKPTYVTVEDYLTFQSYVRDSIAREKIYFSDTILHVHGCGQEQRISDEEAIKWLIYDSLSYYKSEKECAKPDISDRALCHALFSLNWDKKLDYHSWKIIPLVNDLYIRLPERFYRFKDFDDRKFKYHYTDVGIYPYKLNKDSIIQFYPFQKMNKKACFVDRSKLIVDQYITILIDQYSWASKSEIERDEYSVLGHLYTKLYPQTAIIGINNPLAKAYCHWKQELIQKEIDRKKLPYYVRLTLPTSVDKKLINEFEQMFVIPAKEYTKQWQITNNQYNEFIEITRDSILRELLLKTINTYDEVRPLLNYQEMYFDEEEKEYAEFNPLEIELGRSMFPLNYKTKLSSLNNKNQLLIDSIKNTQSYLRPMFEFEYIDSKQKALTGNFISIDDSESLYLEGTGKDLDLSDTNIFGQTTNIRSWEHYLSNHVNVRLEVTLLYELKKTHPDSLIQGITYEQAIAFYYWKYPIHKAGQGDDWQKFVLPTKEQFEAVQRGEQVVVPEKKVAYPTPLFRYVVHVYHR